METDFKEPQKELTSNATSKNMPLGNVPLSMTGMKLTAQDFRGKKVQGIFHGKGGT